MSLPGSGSESEYEPSQSQEMVESTEAQARPMRASRAGTRRTSALFQPGGPLDSQTTDSQWACSYLDEEPFSPGFGGRVDASVQTDTEPSRCTLDGQSCDRCEEAQADYQGVHDELARTQALYAAALAHMDAVRQAVADEPVVLDPTEQAQKVMVWRPLHMFRPPSPDPGSRDTSLDTRSRDPTPNASLPEPPLDARSRKPSPNARARRLVETQPCASRPNAQGPFKSSRAVAFSPKPRTSSGGKVSLARALGPATRGEATQGAPAPTATMTFSDAWRPPRKRVSGPAHGEVIVVSSSEDDEPVKRSPSDRKRPRL